MLYNIIPEAFQQYMLPVSLLISFVLTTVFTAALHEKLPRDGGRDFAVDGKKSAGKPRGAGIIFILVYVAVSFALTPMKAEYMYYLVLIAGAMLTGFLDDAAKSPWGEYLKGALDFLIALLTTAVYLFHNETDVHLGFGGVTFNMPIWLYALCAVVLIWVSINVTNCSDGVDGLSGTVGIITLLTIYGIIQKMGEIEFAPQILVMIFAIAAYLWFNSTPSILMMGDAGSRAIGLFIAIAVIKSNAPLLYIPVAIVFIIDGGVGLVKVFLKRFLKISIFKNTRFPLHDQMKKVNNWSNTQVVYRFAIIQLVIGAMVYFFAK